ncbi:MAG: hypothetical protein J2P37_01210 [Ktedonobacteraceae bacterium]|nr:hypothetical protein [Ktedonobacteraceae bacterium]MBO0791243.1 hypothetical protein [Ktedonobacteraceae bacterium]
MHCPYCRGVNPENASYCRSCGRDLKAQFAVPPASRQPQPPKASRSAVSYGTTRATTRPAQQPRQVSPVPASGRSPQVGSPAQQPRSEPEVPGLWTAPVVPEPEPPVPFPPKTMQQLKALKQGALPFTVVSEEIVNKRKRVVRIAYASCSGWRQVATLYDALDKQPLDQFETTVIQGVQDPNIDVYAFTNGQLVFDRNVRLGSQIIHRYQIETGNGFAADSLRVVLAE